MKLFKAGRPSPAMLVAAIALVFALAGTSIAAPDALNRAVSKSKVKKIAKKQAKKQIRKKAPGLSVANADTVDGFHADFLVRSAFSQIADNALVGPSGAAAVRSATIDAPTNGFLLVNAGSDIFGGPSTPRCVIRVNGTVIPSSEREVEVNNTDNSEEDCTTETTVQVATGTHTVDLFAINGVAAGTRYDEAELQVLFVPFGATGTQPASAAKAAGGGDSNGN